ncbi:MAG: hypothetical protein SWK76_08670 [Actinomycetota bacterium]|nr:hypothetical protein [Actinomycetota bacterium]
MKRQDAKLYEELAKFSLCYALSDHKEADDVETRRGPMREIDIPGLKSSILNEEVRPGDIVEGEALASEFAAIYHPRAYYPSYPLGEIRAALREGKSAPETSPHYLPASRPPPLPDGWSIAFLFPTDKDALDRPDFPAHIRDVLTRDYQRMPLLLPPGREVEWGRVRFSARIVELRYDSLKNKAGMSENSYEVYSARGLTYFLAPESIEVVGERGSLRGSLYTEISLPQAGDWGKVTEILEGVVRDTVESIYPECRRGERQEEGCYLPYTGFHVMRFRRRLFCLVYDPVFVIFRAPRLVGLYASCDLLGRLEESSSLFERFVVAFCDELESGLVLEAVPRIETSYDNRLTWARERGALRGAVFDRLEEEHPYLGATLKWLRGD